ncbi:hypothetical protein BO94DRAFT_574909 [Aspergillus sclerotioniger CBS 115572]|uniref:Uncharacterized protein n=1 Tax=Aspergillus sclerotioniger CBS 115572 TaxID=1450535 RepID=A0A317WN89_9EURO|nr:hypothetical protein BO94DRAFT_574909 [Aspergillus sclerotioniger CBS 115572]PWY87803.1 hypothetical protein BO94DRAFT_574909 [Aspergillus sclerotioniger CBS 115572]
MSEQLPVNPSKWDVAARLEKVENKTIHNIDLTSASTIQLEQYLMLRVARIPHDTEFRPNVAISPIAHRTRGQLKRVEEGVRKLTFETPTKPPSTPVLKPELEHDEVTPETPPEKRSYGPQELLDLNFPRTKDEQIVNTALIDFLNAFTIHMNVQSHWTLYRKPFVANFRSASFEARTDGCLEDGGPKTFAIVEVKPMVRFKQSNRISMQEAAEIVAWIKCEPDPDDFTSGCGLRILISQDRHEIYLTFAEYDANYIRYLNNTLGKDEKPGFLTLHVFGPWDTTRAGDVKQLGSILLAIALRAQEDART